MRSDACKPPTCARALTPTAPQIDISLVVVLSVFAVGTGAPFAFVCFCQRNSCRAHFNSRAGRAGSCGCRYRVFFPTLILAQNCFSILSGARCSMPPHRNMRCADTLVRSRRATGNPLVVFKASPFILFQTVIVINITIKKPGESPSVGLGAGGLGGGGLGAGGGLGRG